MSFNLKLDRAREHLKSFEQEAAAWVETKPYGLVDEPDAEPPPYPIADGDATARRFRVTRVDPVPDRLSLIIGDCVFNLRAALDHLALALAKFHKPTMSDREIQGSEFWIPKDSSGFIREENRKLGCVAPAALAAIKAMQPYHRGSNYHTHPLWQVHELNRIDKHRTLTVCISSPSRLGERGVGFKVPEGGTNMIPAGYVIANVGELKVDAVFLRFAAKFRDPNNKMPMEPHIPLEVAFGNGGPAALDPVIPTLQAICDFVRDSVISPLSKFL